MGRPDDEVLRASAEPMEWAEVDGRMVFRRVERRERMGWPPSMGVPNMRCVMLDFDEPMKKLGVRDGG